MDATVKGWQVNARSTNTPPAHPYHHGNLHSALVEAGLDLTRAAGPAALTLRDATRRLGVSPNAVYRHFADREDLLRAVAARIQQGMAERMASIAPQASPREQLRSVGLGYIDFALGEPGWFEVAFGEIEPRPAEPSGEVALPPPLARLVDALDALVAAGELDPADRPGAEWPCWSAVHGFALLALRGPMRGQPRDVLAKGAARTVDAIIDGVLH